MLHNRFVMVAVIGLGLLVSCGDKLNPGTPEEDTTVDTGTAPMTDGNTTTGNTGTNPNSGGNTQTPANSNSTGTTPSNGNTTPTTPANSNTPTSGGNTTVPSTGKLCGTSDSKISYATHIAPLVTTTCSSCHAGGGGFSPTMTTYANTKAAFTDRGAQDQIDSGAMPQGRTLTTNQKCLYKTWSTTGYNP